MNVWPIHLNMVLILQMLEAPVWCPPLITGEMLSFLCQVCECDQVLLLLVVNELNYFFRNAGSLESWSSNL